MSSSPEEEDDGEYADSNSFLLIIMFGTHFIFFLFTYFWLYPPDQSPKNARMHKMATDSKTCRLTGKPMCPSNRLSIPEIAMLNRFGKVQPCPERNYLLGLEDHKTMTIFRDGEINFLRHQSKLFEDLTMNYGSLIMKRASVDLEFGKSARESNDTPSDVVVQELVALRRPKEMEKEKRRKNKERMDALDQLTRPDSSTEKNNLFSRLITERSRKTPKTGKLTKEAVIESTADKTNQRAPKKPRGGTKAFRSLHDVREKPSAEEVLRKKSSVYKDVRTQEEPTLSKKFTLDSIV